MSKELRIQLGEDGADVDRLAYLTNHVRREMRQLDVEDVALVSGGEAPAGARAFDVLAVGGLLITLGRSAESLRAVVRAVRQWLARGDGVRRTVRLEIGGDVLELSDASAADQDRLVDLFIDRHAARESEPWTVSEKP